jgi:hypothetical protein
VIFLYSSMFSILMLFSLCTFDLCLLKKINHHSIILNFIIQYRSTARSLLTSYTNFVPMVRFLRDFAYDNVADNRYAVFGRSETEACEIL